MDDYWYHATRVLEVLVKFAKGLDENGMDLRFTTGNVSLDNTVKPSKFVDSMRAARPETGSNERAHTDMRRSLGKILHEYQDNLRRRKKVEDTVVIILTDGMWEGMDDKKSLAGEIKEFSSTLKGHNWNLKQRPFSIQFIQFGRDPTATDTLKYYDDYLHLEGIP